MALLSWIHGSAVAAANAPLLAFSAEVAGNTDIYTAHLDGSGLTRLTRGPGADFDPSWSPDRAELAYRCQTGTSSSSAPDDAQEERNVAWASVPE
jgi:Tol biopolymer transport system component